MIASPTNYFSKPTNYFSKLIGENSYATFNAKL